MPGLGLQELWPGKKLPHAQDGATQLVSRSHCGQIWLLLQRCNHVYTILIGLYAEFAGSLACLWWALSQAWDAAHGF